MTSERWANFVYSGHEQLSVGHSSPYFWEASALITEHVAWCGGEEEFLLGFPMFDTLKLNIAA